MVFPANADCMEELDGNVDIDLDDEDPTVGRGGACCGGCDCGHCTDEDPKLASLDGALFRGGRPRLDRLLCWWWESRWDD